MAARFWVGNAAFLGLSNNWNYNTAGVTNWGSASGLIDNVAPPTIADNVTFNGAGLYGNQNSTISATITCLSLTITGGYSGTMTHNAVLTVAGNVTLNTSYTIAGSSSMTISAASTINSGGKIWPNNMSFTGNNTKTISTNNLVISGTLTCSTISTTINKTTSETLTIGGLTATNNCLGNISVTLTGGTWSGATGDVPWDLTLAGNITISSVSRSGGVMTYSSGIISISGTLTINGSSTFNTPPANMTWAAVTTTGPTITLTADFKCSGILSIGAAATFTINKTSAETFTCAGIAGPGTSTIAGTSTLIFSGGNWASNGSINISVTFDGNVTLNPSLNICIWAGSLLKYQSGTVTTTGITLSVITGRTLDTAGISWDTVSINGSTTLTLNSLLTANTITMGAISPTFAGTSGFTCATLSCTSTVAATISFKESITYTITSSLSCPSSRVGSIVLFTSSHASTKANILMPNNGSNTCNVLASFTRIDASGGRTINTFNGTLVDVINIREFHDFQPVAV
tara:strand:+ start:2127 stop:3677 length:1551 start_codon:yes stop_codon:yes gene_type:complete